MAAKDDYAVIYCVTRALQRGWNWGGTDREDDCEEEQDDGEDEAVAVDGHLQGNLSSLRQQHDHDRLVCIDEYMLSHRFYSDPILLKWRTPHVVGAKIWSRITRRFLHRPCIMCAISTIWGLDKPSATTCIRLHIHYTETN